MKDFITVEDLESGELIELDLRNNDVQQFLATRIKKQDSLFILGTLLLFTQLFI